MNSFTCMADMALASQIRLSVFCLILCSLVDLYQAGHKPGTVDQNEVSGKEFYERFVTQGPKFEGDHGLPPDRLDLSILTDLNDPELVAQGRDFTTRNYFSVVLGQFIMMMYALASRYGRVVLYYTGESLTKEKARRRDLSTILRMMKWMEGDMLAKDKRSVGSRDLKNVRQIHLFAASNHVNNPKPELPPLTKLQTQVLEAIRKETEHVDMSVAPDWILRDDPEIPLSQFPMSAGQAGFMGTIVYMPKTFGVTDRKGIDGYVHQWAIIGRHLGIQDEFNWALYHKKTGNDTVYQELLEKLVLPTIKTVDDAGIIMWQAMIDGITDYFPVFRFLPVVKFTLNTVGLPGTHLDPLMDWKDRLSYWFINFSLYSVGKYEAGKKLINFVVREGFNYGSRKYLVE